MDMRTTQRIRGMGRMYRVAVELCIVHRGGGSGGPTGTHPLRLPVGRAPPREQLCRLPVVPYTGDAATTLAVEGGAGVWAGMYGKP